MSSYTKSPKKVLQLAHRVGSDVFELYSHESSPQTYTQPQLFACLVLKTYMGLDYRRLHGLLEDCPELVQSIGMERIPHFTTFQKASERLIRVPRVKKLLSETVNTVGKKKKVQLGSIGSTGFEARHVSQYFLQRTERNKAVFARFHPKLTVICDCETHLIHGFHASRGPKPDNHQLKPTLRKTITGIDKLLGDAGFDGEKNHELCREENGIRSFFPPLIGRPTNKPPRGYWRRKMKYYFKDPEKHHYGQRWQVETAFSMIKRCFGSSLSSKTHHNRLRQLYLLIITHNLAILFNYLFYRAGRSPFIDPLSR